MAGFGATSGGGAATGTLAPGTVTTMFGVTTTTGGTTGTGTTTPSTNAGFFGLEGFSGGADMTKVAPKQTETIKGRRVVFISVDVGQRTDLVVW